MHKFTEQKPCLLRAWVTSSISKNIDINDCQTGQPKTRRLWTSAKDPDVHRNISEYMENVAAYVILKSFENTIDTANEKPTATGQAQNEQKHPSWGTSPRS